jgi:hypothetical protein
MSANITKAEKRRRAEQSARDKAKAKASARTTTPRPLPATGSQGYQIAKAGVMSVTSAKAHGVKNEIRQRILMPIVLPLDNAILRLPTADVSRTAAFHFKKDIDWTPAASDAAPQITFHRPSMVLTGQPGVPMVITTVKTDVLWSNICNFETFNELVSPGSGYETLTWLSINCLANSAGVCPSFLGVGPLNVSVPNFPLPANPPRSAFFLPFDSGVRLRVTPYGAAAGAYDARVVFLRVSSTGEFIAGANYSSNVSGTNADPVRLADSAGDLLLHPGFYVAAMAVKNTATTPATQLSVDFIFESGHLVSGSGRLDFLAGDSSVLRTPLPPQFSEDVYNNTRMTACAALISNITKVLDLEGKISCARLESADIGDVSNPTFYDRVTEAAPAVRYLGPLRNGCYAYIPPEQEAMLFRDYHFSQSVQRQFDTVSLVPGVATLETYTVFYASRRPMSFIYPGDSEAGTQLIIQMGTHLEVRTDNPKYITTVARGSLEDLRTVQAVCQQMPFFYENPLHWRDIAKAANKAWNFIKPYAGKVINEAARDVGRMLPVGQDVPSAVAHFVTTHW